MKEVVGLRETVEVLDPHNNSLLVELVLDVEERIGRLGARAIVLSTAGERYDSIELSRGGLVIEEQSRVEWIGTRASQDSRQRWGQHSSEWEEEKVEEPIYHPELVYVSRKKGQPNRKGVQKFNYKPKKDVLLGSRASHEYVLTQDDNGLWNAHDAFGQVNPFKGFNYVYLKDAKPLEAPRVAIDIQKILKTFDEAVASHAAEEAATATTIQYNGVL